MRVLSQAEIASVSGGESFSEFLAEAKASGAGPVTVFFAILMYPFLKFGTDLLFKTLSQT